LRAAFAGRWEKSHRVASAGGQRPTAPACQGTLPSHQGPVQPKHTHTIKKTFRQLGIEPHIVIVIALPADTWHMWTCGEKLESFHNKCTPAVRRRHVIRPHVSRRRMRPARALVLRRSSHTRRPFGACVRSSPHTLCHCAAAARSLRHHSRRPHAPSAAAAAAAISSCMRVCTASMCTCSMGRRRVWLQQTVHTTIQCSILNYNT
jgi:hypothetical protein